MEEILELENEIKLLEEKIINDFNSLYDGEQELHDKLIKISTSHPEQADLLNFIVFLNDNLSTSQKKGHEAILDNFTKIINNKKRLIKILKQNSEKINKPPIWKRINFKDLKTILLSIVLIILMIGLLFFPEFKNDIKDLSLVIKKIF